MLYDMTYDDLNTLIDYNYWARDRLLEAVQALTQEQFTREMGNSFGSVRDTIAHICDAESIWLSRWNGGQPAGFQKPDRIADLDAVRREWAELERGMREVLQRMGPAGVQRTIEYKDFKGGARSDVFWQMMQHIVNHGSYHRGQVTTMLRQLGAQPPKYMDLIVYYREKRKTS
jgi:uncharacterized damage-inducible protein DinB